MKVGWKWIYEFDDKEVVFDVLRTEKRGDSQVFVVRRTIDKTSVEFKLAPLSATPPTLKSSSGPERPMPTWSSR